MSGIEAALTSVLLSPHFLFLMPGEGGDPASPAAQPLEDHALASRLSYFLWSTMPDDALTADADRAALTAPGGGGLEAQVARMMVDPKVQALVDDLAGQWFYGQYLSSVAPDPELFGTAFDAALLDAMGCETRLFFGSLLSENQPLGQLLTADYSFVNDRLATHYGCHCHCHCHCRRRRHCRCHRDSPGSAWPERRASRADVYTLYMLRVRERRGPVADGARVPRAARQDDVLPEPAHLEGAAREGDRRSRRGRRRTRLLPPRYQGSPSAKLRSSELRPFG